jgi:LmbE family N-acetylglucosaminyl deacetylase
MSDPLGTVLGVWAHPDDETWLCAGLMARAAAAGERVVCVTATRGEQGSTDEERWPPGPTLAAVRTQELARSLEILGGGIEHHFMDYPDGGCAAVDQSEAVERVRALIEEVRPDTVLTFGPDGMTGHTDHQAVGRWTSAALDGSAAALHWATHTASWVERFLLSVERAGALMTEEPPPSTPEQDLSILLELEGPDLERKLEALLAMESQLGPVLSVMGRDGLREGIVEEAFRPGR